MARAGRPISGNSFEWATGTHASFLLVRRDAVFLFLGVVRLRSSRCVCVADKLNEDTSRMYGAGTRGVPHPPAGRAVRGFLHCPKSTKYRFNIECNLANVPAEPGARCAEILRSS